MKGRPSVLILFFFSPAIMAGIISKSDCTTTDVRKTHPTIKRTPELIAHFSRPRNQDSTGWCYAMSGSDLLSAHIGKPVSAIHTSIINNRSEIIQKSGEDSQAIRGGNAKNAIRHVYDYDWVCSENGLSFDVEKPDNIKAMILGLEKLKRDSLDTQNICKDVTEIISSYYKDFSSDVEKIAESLLTKGVNLSLAEFAKDACTEKITKIRRPHLETVKKVFQNKKPNRNYMKDLNNNLTRGYLMEFTYKVGGIGHADGIHSSVVLGREWRNNQCQFYIRNSWGKGCEYYQKHIDCNAEEGAFWISDENFYSFSSSYTFIK